MVIERPLGAARAVPAICAVAGRLLMGVRVIPSAPRTAVRGTYGDRLKVSVSAPPQDDRANQQLVQTLADWLGMRRDKVRIESGHGSRDKVIAFAGIGEAELRQKLAGLLRTDCPTRGE